MCNELSCTLCPRTCGADRKNNKGFCGVKADFCVARAGLHLWEEPCISYGAGSGTVFFSGCPLRCVFCQNHEISGGKKGRYIDEKELEGVIFDLEQKGAVNINFVSPTQYAKSLAKLLERIKPRLCVPVVYNTGGYEKVETLKMLDGLIDVYLPDIKYYSQEVSLRYSNAGDYFEKAICAVKEMQRQTGYGMIEADGGMKKGLCVRHLVLPGQRKDSMRILDELAANFEPAKLYISIMRQYFPTGLVDDTHFPEINRKLTSLEYDSVVGHAASLGFVNGFTQGKDSAEGSFVPDFDF